MFRSLPNFHCSKVFLTEEKERDKTELQRLEMEERQRQN